MVVEKRDFLLDDRPCSDDDDDTDADADALLWRFRLDFPFFSGVGSIASCLEILVGMSFMVAAAGSGGINAVMSILIYER